MIDLMPTLVCGLIFSCMITTFCTRKIESIQDADTLMQYSKLAATGGLSVLFFTLAIVVYFIASFFN